MSFTLYCRPLLQRPCSVKCDVIYWRFCCFMNFVVYLLFVIRRRFCCFSIIVISFVLSFIWVFFFIFIFCLKLCGCCCFPTSYRFMYLSSIIRYLVVYWLLSLIKDADIFREIVVHSFSVVLSKIGVDSLSFFCCAVLE